MLSEKMEQALNDQMNFEFYSAHIYLAMASYAGSIGLTGFENWFSVQYEEEVFHARQFLNYIAERGGRPILTGFENPENSYESILHAFEQTLHHEQIVTSRIYDLADLAVSLRDHATQSFLKWFIDEQVEEENAANDLIDKIKLVKDAGLYLLDKELSTRTFVPPVVK